MIGALAVLFTSIASGILYRLGGSEGWDTKYRDAGVPIMFVAQVFILRQLPIWWSVVALIACFGLMWASLTSYRYFLPKPKDYDWYHYALHGFFIALSALPYIITTGHWIGFALRCALCPALMAGWYFVAKKKDWLHEGGRGAIITATTPLLYIL